MRFTLPVHKKRGPFLLSSNPFGVNNLSALSHQGAGVIKLAVHTCMAAQEKGRTNMAQLLSCGNNSFRDKRTSLIYLRI